MIKFLLILSGIMALWGVVSSTVLGFMSKKNKSLKNQIFRLKDKIRLLHERIASAGKTNQKLSDIKKEKADAKKKPVNSDDLNSI